MTKNELFTEYGSYHADRRNRICHAFGIPLIVLGLMGLGALVRFGPVDLAILTGIAVVAYYATLDVRGSLLALGIFAVLYLVGLHLTWPMSLAVFAIGWVFQLVGHRFEGSKPKFLENLVYLLVGPLYIFEEGAHAMMRRKPVAR